MEDDGGGIKGLVMGLPEWTRDHQKTCQMMFHGKNTIHQDRKEFADERPSKHSKKVRWWLSSIDHV